MNNTDPILGLDLGTSTCLACVVLDGEVHFIEPDRAYSTPSDKNPKYPGEVMPSAFCPPTTSRSSACGAPGAARGTKWAPCVIKEVKRYMTERDEDPDRALRQDLLAVRDHRRIRQDPPRGGVDRPGHPPGAAEEGRGDGPRWLRGQGPAGDARGLHDLWWPPR